MASTPGAAPLVWAARTALLVLLGGGAAANGLALLVFCRRPSLRSPANRFVMNLLATNLTACAAMLPLLLLDSGVAERMALAERVTLADELGDDGDLVARPVPSTWPLDVDALCVVGEGTAAGFCTASILGVLLIAGRPNLFTIYLLDLYYSKLLQRFLGALQDYLLFPSTVYTSASLSHFFVDE